MKKKNSIPGYGPEYEHHWDPFGVYNKSDSQKFYDLPIPDKLKPYI